MSRKRIDLIGKRFGKLVVQNKAKNEGRWTCWDCVCDCGNRVIAKTRDLQKGDVNSCGCLFEEINKQRLTKHGKKNSRLYRIWGNMKTRCSNPTTKYYKYYGGRGITICEEWRNSFQRFYDWAMTNGYSDDLTIDRIDVNGNYEPSNCRWVTMKEQSKNKRKIKR